MKHIITSVIVISVVSTSLHCKSMAVDINYPGVSFKYFISKKINVEPKIQIAKDIFTGGLRSSYYFNNFIYSGIEWDYITFKGEISEGSGEAISIFIGTEIYTTKNITLQFDIGPAFISLDDRNTDLAENGIEIIGNIGVNYYFK